MVNAVSVRPPSSVRAEARDTAGNELDPAWEKKVESIGMIRHGFSEDAGTRKLVQTSTDAQAACGKGQEATRALGASQIR